MDMDGIDDEKEYGNISLSMRDGSLLLVAEGDDSWVVQIAHDEGGGIASEFNREELAEFLHVALCLIDSEYRYLPPYDLIGRNYPD